MTSDTRTCEGCREQVAADGGACPACGRAFAEARCEAHPDRAAAGRCVICGRDLCPACNHGRAPVHLCDEHAEVPVIEGWAQVYTTSTDVDAELIRENLQAEGIDSRVLSQKDHFSFHVDIGDLSPVRVLVPAFAYAEAQELIREHTNAQGEVTFACPECGEAYDAEEPACSRCGAALR